MFETTVHHTVSDNENADYVEANAPFASANVKNAYLGAGYYFWDDHLKLAHWWGRNHCNDNYMICEATFTLKRLELFDLVGDRQDMIYFEECIDKLGVQKLTIGAIIEMLKDLQIQPTHKGIFPYKAIRGMEIQKSGYFERIFSFAQLKPGLASITPKIMICLINKSPEIIKDFKIIYPKKYVA